MVTGVVITTIGLSLMPVAANWAMGGNAKAPGYGSMSNILLALFTLLVVIVLSRSNVPAISRLSILLSIVVGTIGALVVGKADFSKVGSGAIFGISLGTADYMPLIFVLAPGAFLVLRYLMVLFNKLAKK